MGIYLGARLPSTYQEVEWVGSSRTQVINTGVIPTTQTYTAELEFESTQSGAEYWAFGIWGTTGFRAGQGSSGSWDTSYGASYSPSTYALNTRTKATVSNSGKGTSTNTAIGLFGMGENGAYANSRKGAYKIYYCKIWNSGTLIRDFVPCYRKSDNVIGMYDLVNNQFYTNSGSGTFTKGNNVYAIPLKAAYIGKREWSPNANTVAYYPLTTDCKDYSGNGYDLTTSGSGISYTTLDGVNCAKSAGSSNYLQSTTAVLPSGGNSRTVAVWYAETLSSGTHYIVCWGQASSGQTFALQTYSGKFRFTNNSGTSTSTTLTLNKWYSFIVTYSSTNKTKMYVNGVADGTQSTELNTTAVSSSYPLRLFNRNTNTTYPSSGYLSEVIIEDVEWTADEIAAYYNSMKGNYGIS